MFRAMKKINLTQPFATFLTTFSVVAFAASAGAQVLPEPSKEVITPAQSELDSQEDATASVNGVEEVAEESAQSSAGSTTRLSEVVVSSAPLSPPLFESAQPASVLNERDVLQRGNGQLGDLLANLPGVTSSNFGQGSSRPVIRGLSGDRIRILQNGIGTQDVSNTSPDHAVAVDPLTAKKIEVLRGPAALMYGTSAVGGVVNVFQGRIPDELPANGATGAIEARGATVDENRAGGFKLDTELGAGFVFHADTSIRKSGDYNIPGFARTAEEREEEPDLEFPEPRGEVPFSAVEARDMAAGLSYIWDKGFLGSSFSYFDTNYGVPNGENDISIDGRRPRTDVQGKLYDPIEGIESMEIKTGWVDYKHTEFEGSEEGTVFTSKGFDGRYDLTHHEIAGFKGTGGFQFANSTFGAVGEEAFQPETDSDNYGLFLFERTPLSEVLDFELGGRVDWADVSTAELARNFTTFSQSTGLTYNPNTDYAFALALAHTERAPVGQELYADGPHVATAAYEIGDPNLDPERSLGLDLTARKRQGRITGSGGVFYNRINDYISLNPTDSFDDEEEFRIYKFEAVDANFYGFESEAALHFLDALSEEELAKEDVALTFKADYVYAEDRSNNTPLPRTPPLRMRVGGLYRTGGFESALEVAHVFEQSRNAQYETETDGFFSLDLRASQRFELNERQGLEVFLRGENLTNEKQRSAVSFIKDVAPLPGLNVMGGVRFTF